MKRPDAEVVISCSKLNQSSWLQYLSKEPERVLVMISPPFFPSPISRKPAPLLANPMLRPPPRHAQELKNPLLAPPLHQRPLRNPFPIPAPQHIAPQPPLIQAHPLLAGQEPNAAVEDIVAGKINQRGAHLVPGHEQEVDAAPDGGPREASGAMPLGAVRGGGHGERGAEVGGAEEVRDDGVDDEGAQRGGGAVRFGEDEVDVARGGGAAAVGAADGDLDGGVESVDGGAEEGVVLGYFGAGDSREEVVVVVDAEFLVFRERGFAGKVGQGAVALVDPEAGLDVAYAVDFHEFLQDKVVGFQLGVL